MLESKARSSLSLDLAVDMSLESKGIFVLPDKGW